LLGLTCSDFINDDEWQPNLGAMLEAIHKLQPKPKTILEPNDVLRPNWTAVPQKSIVKGVKDFCKRLEACVSPNGKHFEQCCSSHKYN